MKNTRKIVDAKCGESLFVCSVWVAICVRIFVCAFVCLCLCLSLCVGGSLCVRMVAGRWWLV